MLWLNIDTNSSPTDTAQWSLHLPCFTVGDFVHGKINSCKAIIHHCEDGELVSSCSVVQNTLITKTSSRNGPISITLLSVWSEATDKILELLYSISLLYCCDLWGCTMAIRLCNSLVPSWACGRREKCDYISISCQLIDCCTTPCFL